MRVRCEVEPAVIEVLANVIKLRNVKRDSSTAYYKKIRVRLNLVNTAFYALYVVIGSVDAYKTSIGAGFESGGGAGEGDEDGLGLGEGDGDDDGDGESFTYESIPIESNKMSRIARKTYKNHLIFISAHDPNRKSSIKLFSHQFE